MQCSLSLVFLNSSILEHMDEYVELIEATPAKTFFPCILALSKATNITF